MTLVEKLRVAQCSSCTCMTKSPETHWHKEDCRYRLLAEAIKALNKAKQEAKDWELVAYTKGQQADAWADLSQRLGVRNRELKATLKAVDDKLSFGDLPSELLERLEETVKDHPDDKSQP